VSVGFNVFPGLLAGHVGHCLADREMEDKKRDGTKRKREATREEKVGLTPKKWAGYAVPETQLLPGIGDCLHARGKLKPE